MDREIFLDCKIGIEEVGTEFCIPAGGADLVETRRGEIALRSVGVKIVETLEEWSVVEGCADPAEVGWQAPS